MIPTSLSRRSMIKAGIATAAVAVPWLGAASDSSAADEPAKTPTSAPAVGYDRFKGLKVGVCTYTFKQRPLAPTIAAIRQLGLAYCSIKDFHLPLKSTAEQRKEVADQFRAAGITPLSCGTISMRTEADARQAFEYARDAGIPTIVCAPNYDVLPTLDKLVNEFETIRIAIHNHGPEDKFFPSPLDVLKRVKDLDPRVGMCVDVGHCSRAGVDPADAIHQCGERVYDSHLKDIAAAGVKAPIEMGRGVLNIKSILQALLDVKMTGHAGFEHEKDMNEPLPGLHEDVGFVRGIFAGMA